MLIKTSTRFWSVIVALVDVAVLNNSVISIDGVALNENKKPKKRIVKHILKYVFI